MNDEPREQSANAIDLSPLIEVADLVKKQHASCSHQKLAATFAAWLRCVEVDERWEPETAPRIRERTTALELAELWLTTDVPSCTETGPVT